MLALTLLPLVLAVAGQPIWHDDYDQAAKEAIQLRKDLVIYFREDGRLDDALVDPQIRLRLAKFVCLQVPASYEHRGQRLLDHAACAEMMGKPGLAVAEFSNPDAPYYQELISVHPFVRSHYGWAPSYGVEEVKIILDLPPATLSQRSMIYAIRVHPERPQSVYCECPAAFLGHAQRHSTRQAEMCYQHHADLISTSAGIQAQMGVGFGGGSEVVAESWGNFVGGENVLEASFSCVDAWRHSEGHWGAVSRPHRFFGYDVARGSNGTWYATGIFAD